MEIIERIISDGHGYLDPSYIVIHETANPGATALNHVAYWSREDDFAVHYVGDGTGKCYYTVPEDRLCGQVGRGNPYVVGIELCHATNQQDFEVVGNLGVEGATGQLSKRGGGIDQLLSHNDCTERWGGSDHTDPLDYFESYGKSGEQFKDEVAARLSGGGIEIESEDVLQRVYNGGGNVYRVYNPNGGFHHYTISEGEKNGLVDAGGSYEGVAGTAPRSALIPVYRMYNPGNGDHLYTESYETCEDLQKIGGKYEGVSGFSNENGNPVYRVYNPNSGEHFYTISKAEVNSLVDAGGKNEGVAFYSA